MTAEEILELHTPEELFGDVTTAEEARTKWTVLMLKHHPDKGGSPRVAKHINVLYVLARKRIERGVYGGASPLVEEVEATVVSGTYAYEFIGEAIPGDVADLFVSKSSDLEGEWVVKVARVAAHNDLILNETKMLEALHDEDFKGYETFRRYLPVLSESLSITEKGTRRLANVLSFDRDFVSVRQILDAYETGVHPRVAAFIVRRAMEALSFAHAHGIVHAAVVPDNILVLPDEPGKKKGHAGKLIDWCYATNFEKSGRLKAVIPRYRDWYPPEVFDKGVATGAVDTYMVAKLYHALLYGEAGEGNPGKLGATLMGPFKLCLSPDPKKRYQDINKLYDDFNHLLQRIYGPRSYIEFYMPY